MLPKPKKPPSSSSSSFSSAAAGDYRLLHDIQTLSKALSLDPSSIKKPPPSRSISDPKSHLNQTLNQDTTTTTTNKNNNNKPPKKKPSFWTKNWNSLRSLSSQFRSQRRFRCRFSLHVHSLHSLPHPLSSSAFSVHWKRTTDPSSSSLSTRPVRAHNGVVQFDEVLTYTCSVSGSPTGPNGSAKYEPKHFLISVQVVDPDSPSGLDVGKNLMDVTRLLPLQLEELDDGERRVGRWSTSFVLSGKGKGGMLNVSFGFSVIGNGNGDEEEKKVRRRRDRSRSVEDVKVLHEVLPCSRSEASVLRVFGALKENELQDLMGWEGKVEKECEEPLPEFSVVEQGVEIAKGDQIRELEMEKVKFGDEEKEVEIIVEDGGKELQLEKVKFGAEEKGVEIIVKDEGKETELEKNGFGAEGKGVEIIEKDGGKEQELEKIGFGDEEEEAATKKDQICESNDLEQIEKECGTELGNDEASEKPSSQQLEEVLIDLEDGHVAEDPMIEVMKWGGELKSIDVEPETPDQKSYNEVKLNYKTRGMKSRSLSLEDETVASEFLSMLGIDHNSPIGLSSDSDPDSPRERLWKQFKQESLSTGNNIFGIGIEEDGDFFAEDLDLLSMVQEVEQEFQEDNKSRAKMMEDAETEALMRQCGLNEKAFHSSPPGSKRGFGSPIDIPPEEPLELPPLSEGLGPFVQTKDGGFLRSMNPTLFKNPKNNGSLIMQVSNPVVVPAEMGNGIMEILHRLAAIGIEKLSMQAKKLMPLEDITGKTMQQIAWEVAPSLELSERFETELDLPQHTEAEPGASQTASRRNKRSKSSNIDSEYVSLEDLAPLAMDKIEALSIEGLRIQSGMADEEAPSNISPQLMGDISALEGKGAMNNMSLGLEGTGGLQLLDVKDSGGDDIDGLMGLSITLDEWMRLDSGIVDDDDDNISDRTSKILAAHHAHSAEMISGKRGGKKSGRRWGLLGNTFTVALMVQLRDPLCNYEPVGNPMLSLIQVERVFVPPKPKIYSTVSEKGNSEEHYDDEPETDTKIVAQEEKKKEEDEVPQFKITKVHVAGLKTEPGKKKPWGNSVHQQSGSRWLLATGMGKSNKHPLMKSKAVSKPSPVVTKDQPGDTLWSITSRVHGDGAKWKELLGLKSYIRNPNVIIQNESSMLH